MTTYEPDDLIRSEPDEFHLACLLLAPGSTVYLGDALEAVSPTDFYDPALGAIWGFARTIHERGDRVTHRTVMIEAETPTPTSAFAPVRPATIRNWLERLGGEPVYPDRIPRSVRAVVDTAKLRRLVLAGDQIKHRAVLAESYAQAHGWAVELVSGLVDDGNPDEVTPFSELFDQFQKSMVGELAVGQVVPTPWAEVNDMLGGGFHAGRSYVVAGRPGAGKTAMALNVAAEAAEHGFPSLVVSQEMSKLEVTGRLVAAGGRAEYGEVVKGAMSDDTAWRVAEYGDTHRDMPLHVIDRPGMTVGQIGSVARAQKRRTGLDLLVVDYLQLLESADPKLPRQVAVSQMSRSLKLLAKELDVAVLVAAQLNRDNTRGNRNPVLSDLRESGAIEQDCDAAVFLHHERTPEDTPSGDVLVIVAKNRFGRTGEFRLRWRGHQARMGD